MPNQSKLIYIYIYIPIILSLSEEYSFKNWRKWGLSVNYFANLRAKCHFPKLECNEFNFPKRMGCQCNLPFY